MDEVALWGVDYYRRDDLGNRPITTTWLEEREAFVIKNESVHHYGRREHMT